MKLSEVKSILKKLERENSFKFLLENGEMVDPHFHITEVGLNTKNFIDCGGQIRTEKKVNFQLWHADDYDHRLSPSKFLKIIDVSEESLYLSDEDVEVEYQSGSISTYQLNYSEIHQAFILKNKYTNCLAMDLCGIPQDHYGSNIECSPGSGCC